MNDRTLAERALRRAVASGPYTPDTWVALAHFLVATGKRPQAVELVADVDRKAPPKSRLFVKARLQQALGNIKEADAAFEAAVLSRPTDFVILLAAADYFRQADQPTIAVALYKKVLKPSLATPAEIAARARRGSALALAATSPAEAAAVLAANKSRNELVDVRLSLFLDGLDPARRPETIAEFEKSQSRGPFTADESFWLAQLVADKPDGVAARLDPLIADDKDTPQMLAFYARTLLQQDKRDAARRVVDRLVEREPDSTRTKDVQAKLLALRK